MASTIRISNIASLTELAAEHDRSVRTFRTWKKHRTFPRPFLTVGGVQLYDRALVSAWVTDHEGGHGRHLDAIREYRRTGSIAAAARLCGTSTESVRRWCRKHGEPLPRDPRPEDVTA